MERTLNKLLIIALVVCVAFAVAVVQAAPQESAGLNGEHPETAEQQQQPTHSTEKTYPLGLSKNNYILFVVGTSIGSFLLASIGLCCCIRRCRRRRNRRRYIQPEYSAMKPGEKKFESRQSVLMVPARDVLFPTQLSAVHEKSRHSAKDGDVPKWSEKPSIERHSTIRVPRNSVRKNWTPGTDREPSGELKAQSWLAEQEQQRETRKNWLHGVEAQREDKKSWVAGLAQRSTSPEPVDPTKAHLRADGRSAESRRSWISGLAQREGIDASSAQLPTQAQREVARENRRSSFIASLKQRETNPDGDLGNAREQSRDGRRSWNPEVARRESLKRSGSRRSTTYRPNEASNSGNGAATKAGSAGDPDDTGRPQSGRRQSLYGEGGTMWETVLERV